jgi:hypothetical protein
VRADLLLQVDRVVIGTDAQLLVIGLSDPARPQLLGAVDGMAARLVLPDGTLSNPVVKTIEPPRRHARPDAMPCHRRSPM